MLVFSTPPLPLMTATTRANSVWSMAWSDIRSSITFMPREGCDQRDFVTSHRVDRQLVGHGSRTDPPPTDQRGSTAPPLSCNKPPVARQHTGCCWSVAHLCPVRCRSTNCLLT